MISPDALWISGTPYEYGADDAGYYDDHRNHVLLRTFDMHDIPDRATLAIAVLGFARIFINGKRVGSAELLGDWTNFTKIVYYRTYRVDDLLRRGANTIEIELGNGWYNPAPLRLFGKYNLRARLAEVGTPQALVSLEGDGKTLLVSDSSWTWREGELLFNNLYLGERRDLRSHASAEACVCTRSNTRNLEESPVEPCRRAETVPGKDIRTVSSDCGKALLIDFHETVTGFAVLDFRAHEGDTVRVRYAESADEQGKLIFNSNYAGMVGTIIPHANPDGSDVLITGGPGAPETGCETDEIICREGANHFENAFSTHSFRYALIDGIARENLLGMEAVYVHTDLRPTGSIETGNVFFDTLLDAARRTKLNNIHGTWEDCARERLGYGGDMVALADSNLLSFDCEGLIRKVVRDFRNDQTERGGVPETAPYVGIQSLGTGEGEGPLMWQLAYPYLTLKAYQYYGARDLVEQEWPYIKKLVDYLLGQNPEELSERCLGDHGSVQTHKDNGSWKGGTPDRSFTGWCALLWFALLAERIGTILDEPVDAYRSTAQTLEQQIRERFLNDDGTFGNGTQTSCAFAGAFSLMNPETAGNMLAKLMTRDDNVLSAGIFGARFAWRLLHATANDDAAERWLMRKQHPSYSDMLSSGNGTLAEMFENTVDSFNHAMFSSYVQWFYESLGGVRVAEDAVSADHIVFAPFFSHQTNHVSARLQTRKGEVSCTWTRHGDGIDIRLSWPRGTRSDVIIPGAQMQAETTDADGTHIQEWRLSIS